MPRYAQDLAQLAWNFMNDGLRTNVFLKYGAHIIACAVLQLGASKLGECVFIYHVFCAALWPRLLSL
jgi:hypothetical protein